MTTINKGTKKAMEIINTFKTVNKGKNIFEAYKTTPSYEKINTFNKIESRAKNTSGYNDDLKIVAASSWFYSTMYSYNNNGVTFIVYDTPSNTFVTEF